MKKTLLSSLFIIASLLLSAITTQSSQDWDNDLRSANDAWDNGNYAAAIQAYLRLLKSSESDNYIDPIAIKTGTLYRTKELTTDARSPRLSSDGKLISYESGSNLQPTTLVIKADSPHQVITEFQGSGAVISQSGRNIAYLKIKPSEELEKGMKALGSAQGGERLAVLRTANFLMAKQSVIVLRNLISQHEEELNTAGLLKTSLVFGADDETIYFVGANENDDERNDVYAVTPSTAPVAVTEIEGFKSSPLIARSGKKMLVLFSNTNPLPRPTRQQQTGAANTRQSAATTPPNFSQQSASPGFGIVDLATKKISIVSGISPSLSPVISDDESEVAYLQRSAQENSLQIMSISGSAPRTLLKTTDALLSPSFSPDGKNLIYSRRVKEDFETYIIGRDGKNETRITREIQHNQLPRFITNSVVLDLLGEPRHRRAWLYDLESGQNVQLFRNNTVRTISPEYDWQVSSDGSKMLILADGDGDTVSPERGLYLVDLKHKVSKEELIARLEKNLIAELILSSEGKRMFSPIAADVQRVLSQASVNRVYEYQKALFDFDSKHISRPGNQKAIEYLYQTYKSFGYEPVKQCFEVRGALGGKTCNVYATLKGTEHPDLIYIVGSHFDSVAAGPGADDDTSGTAALLEAARILARAPQPATIIFISYTGEEAGLLGSREFVRQAQASKMNIVGVLNNDMIGWANDHRLDNTIRYSNTGIRDILHAAAMQFTKLITYDARWHRGTDATAFYEVYGDIIGGIGSYPVLGNPHYHQATDLLEGINHQLVTETSKTTAATLMMLASSPSPVQKLKLVRFNNTTAELSWASALEKDVKKYIVAYEAGNKDLKQIKVNVPNIILKDARPGTLVKVKAVNARGVESWDWTQVKLETAGQPRPQL